MSASLLFDESTRRKLARLTLTARQVRAGQRQGERRSTRRGQGLEFTDHRDYTPGDDLRRLDWNAYARLDRPFLKLFQEADDLTVHLLVDLSASMDWGEGDQNKRRFALHLAAGLGSLALNSGDPLHLYGLVGPQPLRLGETLRGDRALPRLLHLLETAPAPATADLGRALDAFLRRRPRPGLCLLISDLLAEPDPLPVLARLAAMGSEITLLHLLAPSEVEPTLAGDLRLVDVETAATEEVSLDAAALTAYRRGLNAWRDELAARSRAHGLHFLPIVTDTPWETVILRQLRAAGGVA